MNRILPDAGSTATLTSITAAPAWMVDNQLARLPADSPGVRETASMARLYELVSAGTSTLVGVACSPIKLRILYKIGSSRGVAEPAADADASRSGQLRAEVQDVLAGPATIRVLRLLEDHIPGLADHPVEFADGGLDPPAYFRVRDQSCGALQAQSGRENSPDDGVLQLRGDTVPTATRCGALRTASRPRCSRYSSSGSSRPRPRRFVIRPVGSRQKLTRRSWCSRLPPARSPPSC